MTTDPLMALIHHVGRRAADNQQFAADNREWSRWRRGEVVEQQKERPSYRFGKRHNYSPSSWIGY